MGIYLLLFIVGLVVGSFLSVIVYRETNDSKKTKAKGLSKYLPSWMTGRSYCDHCKKKLSWYENIPLLSYVIQSGKCRHCGKKIKATYPLFELFTALEFVWIYWIIQRLSFFGQLEGTYSFVVLGFWIFIFSLSFVLSIIDIKSGILPDFLVFAGIGISVLRLLATGRWEFLLAGLGLFLFFLLLYLLTQGKGIGFGDVKLAFFIGVTLGWWQWVLVAMFVAFVSGSIFGIMLMISKKKTMKSSIPFGPFLLAGMLVAKIWGEQIWIWYLNLM